MTVDSGKLQVVGEQKFLAVVDAVNRSLTQKSIVDLNAAVTSGQTDVEVARRYLRDAGLLQPYRSGGN
jgi:glycine betaine/choline ABC-type transport system substrate-binding protein